MKNLTTKTTTFNQRDCLVAGLTHFLLFSGLYDDAVGDEDHPLREIFLIGEDYQDTHSTKSPAHHWQVLLTKLKHLDDKHYSPPVVQFAHRAICDCLIKEFEFRPEYQSILQNKNHSLAQIYHHCQAWLNQHQKREQLWYQLLKLMSAIKN